MRNSIFAAAVSLLVSSCSSAPRTCAGLETFFKTDLERYSSAVDEASKLYQEEQWRVEAAAPDASMEKMSKLFEKVQAASYDTDVVLKTRAIEEATRPMSCPFREKITRARGLLDAGILTDAAVIAKEKANQDLQDKLANTSNAFRMTVAGEKEPVSRAIFFKKLGSTGNRAEREKMFREHGSERAKKWLEWGFRELIRSRNEEGVQAGFKNYYDYRFFRGQLNLANYRAMTAEVKGTLAPKLRAAMRDMAKQAGIAKIETWDTRYLHDRFTSGPLDDVLKKVPETAPLDAAKLFYSGLGITIDDYHFVTDLFPRPGKNTHAFAMSIVFPHVDDKLQVLPLPKPDIRFLANLKKPVKWDDISTVIHELGHAVHAAEARQPLGIFRGDEAVSTEAIAMTVQRMANSPEFLRAALPKLVKIPKKELDGIVRRHLRAARLDQAFSLVRQVFFSDFEYEMYADPTADFAKLWSKLTKEYYDVDVDPGIADWDVEHFVMAPVYVQSYAIGILMVEQLYASILRDFKTSYQSVKLGDKLKKVYFAPGEEYDYLALTEHFTGKPLTAAAALELLNE